MDWPPYSLGENPRDFFLWGHLKDQVNCHNPETIEQLEQYICSACEAIPPETFTRVSARLDFSRQQHHLLLKILTNFENFSD